jgi:signal peptidase II
MSLIKPQNPLSTFLSVSGLVVATDQLIKYWIRQEGGFYVCNRGIAFDIRLSHLNFWLIVAVLFLSILWFYHPLYKKVAILSLFLFGLALFFGGAVSNIIDRLFLGCVLDYFTFLGPLFPAFNLGDLAISIGTSILLFKLFFPKIKFCG